MINTRLNSISIVGGAFGDEGKGKIVDQVCNTLVARFGNAIVYRWNGGANAGHAVEIKNRKIVLHQIPSGIMVKGATCILGKGMVIHPGDLVEELNLISDGKDSIGNILVDEMAPLSLDTHRAFETVLKTREEGGAGSTGRGISPAYADIIYRHPVRARDLISNDWEEKIGKHYLLYRDLISGLKTDISKVEINTLTQGKIFLGSKASFVKRLRGQRDMLADNIKNVYAFVKENWTSTTPFVFEGAQGIGLDLNWGVYPDVTASDPTPSGIFRSTEGIVNPDTIEIRTNIYKATYTSSVGKRVLPTKMDEALAVRIREDAHEYGATTKRQRDIYHIDIPALSYFAKVSNATHMVLTHMDVCYSDTPIKVCIAYTNKIGEIVDYRPDQTYLNNVSPVYKEFSPWNGNKIKDVTDIKMVPAKAKAYIDYLSSKLDLKCLMITTGAKRESVITFDYLLL